MFRLISALVGIIVAALVVVFPRLRLRLSAREIIVGNHGYDPDTMVGINVARYQGTATGNAPPLSELRTNHPTALVTDFAGTTYVASDTGSQVSVYSQGATGNDPRLRNLQGPNTGIYHPLGLALDGAGNLYVAEGGGGNIPSAVLKFAPGADGDVAPIARIPSILPPGGATAATNTQLSEARGVAVDRSGRIYVVDRLGDRLLIFDAGASGDVAPLEVVTTGLSSPQQVVLDYDENVYVSNRGTPSIVTYAERPTSSAVPVRTIMSSDLGDPYGLAVDGRGQIYIANTSHDSVTVFAEGASGNVAAIRKIQGPATRLKQPLALAIRLF
jgi:sugar lactone lactonase YvrE